MEKREKKDLSSERGIMRREFDIIRAAKNCDYEGVDYALSDNPRCINYQDENGLTATHHSVALINYGMVKKLITQKGFDPFVKDRFNRMAVDCIYQYGMHDIRKILLHKMYGVFPELEKELRFS